MIASFARVQRVIIYEGPQASPLTAASRLELIEGLLGRGYATSLKRDSDPIADFSQGLPQIVVGQFEGTAPEWLQADGNGRPNHVVDLTGRTAAEVVEDLAQSGEQGGGRTAKGWKPWFPVIDYDRCTNCMQCLSFCLFDVYGVTSGGKITVQNESNCKTDCPACSRVCPEVAILFPKYKAGPINGDEVNADDLRREAMKVDISALLGGDIYSMLRDRSAKAKSRFSKERDDDRALKERQRCLQKLKENADLEIPPEVLASLPSLDQIQEKAVAARNRAAAALAQQSKLTE